MIFNISKIIIKCFGKSQKYCLQLFVIIFISSSIIASSCSKDKSEFQCAENEFSAGNIEKSKKLFEEFINKHSTSKLKSIAEEKLYKCNKIIQLKDEAIILQERNEYSKAKDLFLQISNINSNAIDTIVVFRELDSNEKAYKRQVLIEKLDQKRITDFDKFLLGMTPKEVISNVGNIPTHDLSGFTSGDSVIFIGTLRGEERKWRGEITSVNDEYTKALVNFQGMIRTDAYRINLDSLHIIPDKYWSYYWDNYYIFKNRDSIDSIYCCKPPSDSDSSVIEFLKNSDNSILFRKEFRFKNNNLIGIKYYYLTDIGAYNRIIYQLGYLGSLDLEVNPNSQLLFDIIFKEFKMRYGEPQIKYRDPLSASAYDNEIKYFYFWKLQQGVLRLTKKTEPFERGSVTCYIRASLYKTDELYDMLAQ